MRRDDRLRAEAETRRFNALSLYALLPGTLFVLLAVVLKGVGA